MQNNFIKDNVTKWYSQTMYLNTSTGRCRTTLLKIMLRITEKWCLLKSKFIIANKLEISKIVNDISK